MSRVITFSRVFPAYHPKKGQPTHFVEKVWYGLVNKQGYSLPIYFTDECPDLLSVIDRSIMNTCGEKHHTIRAGNRWKVGDKFSPRVWSGKPYASKQIIIAPDIEIKKIWGFEMDECGVYSVSGFYFFGQDIDEIEQKENELAQNDGLDKWDLFHWFMPNINKPKAFKGQIICWNENINYW